ncbi:YscO family type III secretion system apparatus protein [Labrenzia sp. OB1]|uniref:type III secretion system stalk subunit SctO n=1 Tax=Labrenzia sp. OB1 TaxID=1561204 RepID=UPI0007B286D7|nr:YscO family type III secretion system apparatus protein [Labrenzia sp. OB1]KZM47397.1 hypothetical protein OA90_26175 [Labrenzia sp. OB1]
MIGKFKTLRKVKETKEDLALRALRAKRRELAEANEIRRHRDTALKESTSSLKLRESDVYQGIMHKSVSFEEIDEVKDKVLMLHKNHQQLRDDYEVAAETCCRLSEELKSSQVVYHTAQRTREKFDNVLEDLQRDKHEQDELNEELAVEDNLSKGMPRPL